MYTLAQLKRGVSRGLSNPAYFGRELNRLYHRRFYRRAFNTGGRDVMAADWDTLLILDACRYDTFEATHELPGDLSRAESRGSHTREFLRGNFGGRDLRDTVYVTASPQLRRWRDHIDVLFHDVVDVWREDGWDDDHATVLPGTMADHVRRAVEEFPRKRIIGHFLQPHYPFLRTGEHLNTGRLRDGEGHDVWGQLMRGELMVSRETIRTAIRENLETVLPVVEDLLAAVPGRTVVTSDHGNMLGERSRPVPVREWGHPPSVYTSQLVTVPWLVHESGPRPEIRHEAAAADAATAADGVVTERLEQLGYG